MVADILGRFAVFVWLTPRLAYYVVEGWVWRRARFGGRTESRLDDLPAGICLTVQCF